MAVVAVASSLIFVTLVQSTPATASTKWVVAIKSGSSGEAKSSFAAPSRGYRNLPLGNAEGGHRQLGLPGPRHQLHGLRLDDIIDEWLRHHRLIGVGPLVGERQSGNGDVLVSDHGSCRQLDQRGVSVQCATSCHQRAWLLLNVHGGGQISIDGGTPARYMKCVCSSHDPPDRERVVDCLKQLLEVDRDFRALLRANELVIRRAIKEIEKGASIAATMKSTNANVGRGV